MSCNNALVVWRIDVGLRLQARSTTPSSRSVRTRASTMSLSAGSSRFLPSPMTWYVQHVWALLELLLNTVNRLLRTSTSTPTRTSSGARRSPSTTARGPTSAPASRPRRTRRSTTRASTRSTRAASPRAPSRPAARRSTRSRSSSSSRLLSGSDFARRLSLLPAHLSVLRLRSSTCIKRSVIPTHDLASIYFRTSEDVARTISSPLRNCRVL